MDTIQRSRRRLAPISPEKIETSLKECKLNSSININIDRMETILNDEFISIPQGLGIEELRSYIIQEGRKARKARNR